MRKNVEIAKETNMTQNSIDEKISELNVKGEGSLFELQTPEIGGALANLKVTSLPSNDTKINTVYDPLSYFPTELVSKIFMCLRPLPMKDLDCHIDYPFMPQKVDEVVESMKNLLLLGAVCRAWRSLAWSLPQLWTTIAVNAYNRNENIPEMMRQWFRRSDDLPLYIYLYTAQKVLADGQLSPHPFGNEPYIPRIMHRINACSERWFYLNLALPKRFMQQVHCYDTDAPMLQTLTLRLITDGIVNPAIRHLLPIRFGVTPNLRKVNLYGITLLGIETDWSSVTDVYTELSSSPIEACYVWLGEAPNLINLTLGHLMMPHQGPILRHQNLRSLQMNGPFSDDGQDSLLDLLDLPALEDLAIFANRTSNLDTVANLLQRSSCTLKTFRLNITDNWMEHKQKLLVILNGMPDLEHLELECRYHQAESDESPLPSQLPAPAIIEEMKASNESIFLHNLTKVHIHLESKDWECTQGLQLRPGNATTALPSESDDDDTEPSGPLYLTPLYIYYLLDPEIQKRIQLVIESGYWVLSFWSIFHPIMGFLRQSLQAYFYKGDMPTSIG